MNIAAPTRYVSRTDYLSIQADIDGVDAAAAEMERKWGVGRLRILVPAEMRQKFDAQRDKLNDAIWSGEVAATRQHAEAMMRGWRALDAKATEMGCAPLKPEVWEAQTRHGEIIAIVRTAAEAAAITREGRRMQVWTLAEIGRLIGDQPDLLGYAKTIFEGTYVGETRTTARPTAEGGAVDDLDALLAQQDSGSVLP